MIHVIMAIIHDKALNGIVAVKYVFSVQSMQDLMPSQPAMDAGNEETEMSEKMIVENEEKEEGGKGKGQQ
jgi:hypothetical protein